MKFFLSLLCLIPIGLAFAAEPEFPLTPDSKPQPGIAKGELVKDSYTAPQDSVFPGTVREYQVYLPAGFDKTQPAAFMVFQDGVIYQAPVVFDNLIAKKDIPPLVGIFIKPGVVPAAHDNALPRFNRSYEYDSITDTYSRFLIDEFLPALEAKHGIKLNTDPNQAAISGNSSGGICAFMTAWHRPDRFRRVFTGVGTYVGIHGADQLPVLVRKIEPKPLRIFLQSGTGDNNLYCGDWWMANQMMERSLTWAGYDVNHAWGEGGHNQKHASQIFPDVLRWLWRDWQTDLVVKVNPKGESRWKGYEVVGDGEWKTAIVGMEGTDHILRSCADGTIFVKSAWNTEQLLQSKIGAAVEALNYSNQLMQAFSTYKGDIIAAIPQKSGEAAALKNLRTNKLIGTVIFETEGYRVNDMAFTHDGKCLLAIQHPEWPDKLAIVQNGKFEFLSLLSHPSNRLARITLSPDQSQVYVTHSNASQILSFTLDDKGTVVAAQPFYELDNWDNQNETGGLCVDSEGRLYVATSLGIQVCDQAGRVNFIIPTPKPPQDVCFGGKDLSELFIACGDTIYKRPTKVHGVVSGQQAPIKPAAPKL